MSEWVSGIATAIAVVVAIVFSLRTERQQREQKLTAVHAWAEVQRTTGSTASEGTLWLINKTDSPIYEWDVVVAWPGKDGAAAASAATTGAADWGLLPPGKHDFDFSGDVSQPLPDNDAQIKVELTFRDARGHLRRRHSSGKLE